MKGLIFWEYRRGSWQYDVIVVAILAFIFLTPREIFRDQPKAASVVQVPAEQGAQVFWIEPSLLPAGDEATQRKRAEELLQARLGRRLPVVRLEPISDSEDDVKGYLAYTRP